MCIGLASRNQHEVQAAKMADIWPLKTCWDTLMEKCESETKELLQRYNEEECSRIDKRQGKAMCRKLRAYQGDFR